MSKGGLYHVMFLFLILQVFFCFFWLNFNLYVYPLLSSAAWYVSAALSNTSSSDEIFDSLWFIFSGIRLMMLSGWLLFACTKDGTFLSFIKCIMICFSDGEIFTYSDTKSIAPDNSFSVING